MFEVLGRLIIPGQPAVSSRSSFSATRLPETIPGLTILADTADREWYLEHPINVQGEFDFRP
jgi:hypothetical protein